MERLEHECGIVLIRLRKPIAYYKEKYGTWRYGLNKLYLMMEKQHNRGQEGAGLVALKMNAPVGEEYLFRERALGTSGIADSFQALNEVVDRYLVNTPPSDEYVERHLPFAGEIYMGHLRYATTGKAGEKYLHPVVRRDNWRAKTLSLCGNFNLTNVDEIFDEITAEGQHPRDKADMHVVLEQLGHRLDREVERKYRTSKGLGHQGMEITNYIEEHIDVFTPLEECARTWDGGYVMCGVSGSGEMFVTRDPWGIRPCFYYYDDEIAVVASERPVIQTVMNITSDKVIELKPGEGLKVTKAGEIALKQIREPKENKSCSFERIYFSRGSDRDIYLERKALGRQLVPEILRKVDYDLDHSVFSFIPNTAEVAYYGMLSGLEEYNNSLKVELLGKEENRTPEKMQEILSKRVRYEKVAIKDIKLRTFISEGNTRNDLAKHVYDITYGTITPHEDNLIVIDDSIVRGTTLKESIISILNRLRPKKIVIVSSSPQIRYPDYYGINMSRLKEFVAFRAAIELLKEQFREGYIREIYERTKAAMLSGESYEHNFVKEIYEPFTVEELNRKMVALMKPEEVKCDVELVFQSIEGLHTAIPNHLGDWYFTGDYPTRGGTHMVNKAMIDFYENDYL